MLSSSLQRGIASNSNINNKSSESSLIRQNSLNKLFSRNEPVLESHSLFSAEHTKDSKSNDIKSRKLSICELQLEDVSKFFDVEVPKKRARVEPITIFFDKVTKKGEGRYYFNNNYKIEGAEGYCDGMTNLFFGSFLQTIREPEDKKQTKLNFLENLRIRITPFDALKKLVDNKPYSLHSSKLANKYITMRMDFMSKAVSGQLAPDYIPQYFDRIGQIACYPKDMLKSLFDAINFMKLNNLGHMGLKISTQQHIMGMFVVRDEKKNLYIVYSMDPNEGARYKRTEITDSQLSSHFKDSIIFNFLNHDFLQDSLVGIDCIVGKDMGIENLYSDSLINQVHVTSIPHTGPDEMMEQIHIVSDILHQSVETDNMQLLEFGINLIKNNKDVAYNVPCNAKQRNGASLATSLLNIAIQLKYEDIALKIIKEFKTPALSLGINATRGNFMRFIDADRKELDTPLETAVYNKSYKVFKLLLDTDREINTAGFKLNDTHKIEKGDGLKETIELMLREQSKLVEYAKIKLSLN